MIYISSVLRAPRGRISPILLRSFLLFFVLAGSAVGQSLAPYDRDNAKAMLSILKDDIKSGYYDKGFRGIDLDKHFKDAELDLKAARTRDELMAVVAKS